MPADLKSEKNLVVLVSPYRKNGLLISLNGRLKATRSVES